MIGDDRLILEGKEQERLADEQRHADEQRQETDEHTSAGRNQASE
jgi:hypothetical protein